MGQNSRVFAIQKPAFGIDISPALRFGQIHFLLDPDDLLDTDRAVAKLTKALADFSDDDYILCIGDPTAILAAGIIASQANGGDVKALRWFKRELEYFVFHIKTRVA